jgi:hypothetical protein
MLTGCWPNHHPTCGSMAPSAGRSAVVLASARLATDALPDGDEPGSPGYVPPDNSQPLDNGQDSVRQQLLDNGSNSDVSGNDGTGDDSIDNGDNSDGGGSSDTTTTQPNSNDGSSASGDTSTQSGC